MLFAFDKVEVLIIFSLFDLFIFMFLNNLHRRNLYNLKPYIYYLFNFKLLYFVLIIKLLFSLKSNNYFKL